MLYFSRSFPQRYYICARLHLDETNFCTGVCSIVNVQALKYLSHIQEYRSFLCFTSIFMIEKVTLKNMRHPRKANAKRSDKNVNAFEIKNHIMC
jgi:hypothetical protein